MPEYTVHPGDIMIKFTGPEDRIIRVSDGVPDKVSDGVSDKVSERETTADASYRRSGIYKASTCREAISKSKNRR